MSAIYDRIGVGYTAHRRPDPRIQALIDDALGDAVTVLNVGAGTGSYEPTDRQLIALERSMVMIEARAADAAPVVQGRSEALPFPDDSFDVGMALMTTHHWDDWRAGIAELQRVSERQVLYVIEPGNHNGFWLIDDYFPTVLELPSVQSAPVAEIADAVVAGAGPGFTVDTIEVPIPHDFEDAVLWANWRRPEAYLDPSVLQCNSATAQLAPDVLEAGRSRLAAELESGTWHEKYGWLLEQDEVDAGFRLLVTRPVR
jgi:hypothetical protein